jgi:hypothetical protein
MSTWAQTQTSAPVAKNPCQKPDDYPSNLSSDTQRKAWQKTMDTYGTCIKTFIEEQRAITESATKSANDAVTEYNAVAAKAKEQIERLKQ